MTLLVDVRHRLGDFRLDAGFASDGGVTALFGRSGSGKTSLIRAIAGLIRPDEGRIVLDGDVLVDTSRDIFVPKHRRRFGYVFQEARLFPHFTVRGNLAYGRWFAPRDAVSDSQDRVIELLGIGHLLDRRPANLSGGERQRVAIGRALLSAPRLLLMDEPLAALDEERKAEILPYLERLRDETKVPIVYVSHAVHEVARLADRVVLMRDGRVVATGRVSDVLSAPAMNSGMDRREMGSVLSGVTASFDPPHRLATVQLQSNVLHVPNSDVAEGAPVRVHIPARDVMLAIERPSGLSALNILDGRIETIVEDSDGMVTVRVDCGGDVVHARITGLSVERLDLQPGKPVFAVIKTVALDPR
ncbi:molybdenum ABC transporter ATP-binding protein [Mycoplana rhizolycopersici]|uniref:Molybdenum ABC transporter ATP-binding protein n=1 Tax=Mycoplana rhizolycopersici TaxID=2746702 RepID=A0ABX2QIG9_9HYPH|nr:molybdenum ABC transporter ATP-binding protein [Rhizobium rhizolycopersici]NVP56161.1 molybdenum ABC transporter ATP-binding protein [Rhizobium rhizolycopersici]